MRNVLGIDPSVFSSVGDILTEDNDSQSNANDFGRAAYAVKIGTEFEALEELLDAKDRTFDINARDKYGNTLLLMASQQGDSKRMCKILLRRGADISAQNHMGNTVLHYLMKYNHANLTQYMIRKGADDSLLNADML